MSYLHVASLLAGGLAAMVVTTSARADDDLSVLLDFAPWGLHAAMHLSEEKGWFKEQGLNVSVRDARQRQHDPAGRRWRGRCRHGSADRWQPRDASGIS